MTDAWTRLTRELDDLLPQLPADFAAAACFEPQLRRVSWPIASGSLNGRYSRMTAGPGVGIAGYVIRHGRPVAVGAPLPDPEALLRRCPLLLAERLQAAIAVPIAGEGNAVCGVLVAGARTKREYGEAELRLLELSARRLLAAAGSAAQ